MLGHEFNLLNPRKFSEVEECASETKCLTLKNS